MPSSALSYFLDSSSEVIAYECLEISHPAFTQTYYRVRNNRDGIDVVHEDSSARHYEWYPMQITELGDAADLDNGIRVSFGDLGEVLPKELDAVQTADLLNVKPTVVYRVFRSDELEDGPIIGPITLEVAAFSFAREGATFDASAPYVNNHRTGEFYDLSRFYPLRSTVK